MTLAIVAAVGVVITAAGIVTTGAAKDPPTANLGMLAVVIGALMMLGTSIAAVLL